ncbi:SGNH/GDSL hydrolase family protein [Flaviaesturariibacter aridisoli]|uniref:SGNH/GDSL hydrolase family protein n=1 Tax=Flaviaesturariibacter aridisoli TaxID=2545761 RepID=A0A4R4DZ30_9BACT|nr:SGNH/GDSL hydrolase family protein [Flaviaesturariibacter aridisoli]TCZ71389.1 SGNH/GDSL hydrolase family protein [Flaviaesturariibacter aridisoli]
MTFLKAILGLGLLLSGCSKKPAALVAPPAPTPALPAPAPPAPGLAYLALGDSYTIGQSVGETERFPYLLTSRLADSGLRVGNLRYIARTGWTTDELQAAIAAGAPTGNWDLVTLLIGVNDQYRGRDTASYAPRFTQLLQTAISLAGGRPTHVFVLSIPDYSATPFVSAANKARVSRAIDDFNAVNRRITEAYGVRYTDITPESRLAAGDPGLLAADNLHYSAREHAIWAEKLLPKVTAVLR